MWRAVWARMVEIGATPKPTVTAARTWSLWLGLLSFVQAVFAGTHTNECEGFPPVTNKSMTSDYAYTLTFDGNGKICAMSKIW